MEEGQVSVDGVSHPLPRPFLVAATQNPVEYEGTYPLPEAQLDRFLLKVVLPVPDRAAELEIVSRHAAGFDPQRRRAPPGSRPSPAPTTSPPARRAVRQVQVSPEVAGYVVDVARATRQAPSLGLGASPRGAVALMRTARAWAWLSGRDFVTPDDVKALAQATLAHRLSLRPEAELEGVEVGAVLVVGPGLGARASLTRARRPMTITGRVPLLLLLGLVAVRAAPGRIARCGCGCWSSPSWSGSTSCWRRRPARLSVERLPPGRVRAGHDAASALAVENTGSRRASLLVRDAWQPSAGAHDNRHRLRLAAGRPRSC